MTDHDFEQIIDQGLARRLAALDADVADDGFTSALMARLPARRARPRPARRVDDENAWLFGAAAAIALACWLVISLGSSGAAPDAILAPLEQADRAGAAAAWLTTSLQTLLADHLPTLVAAALCAATLLMPGVLED